MERAGVYRRTRTIVARLVESFAERGLESTWAFVGSLVGDPDESPPVDHLPPQYRTAVQRFVADSDPASRSLADLTPGLAGLGTLLDLGSHSATHVRPRTAGADREAVVADFRVSLEQLAGVFGRPVRSIVFPRDEIDHMEAVGRLGRLSMRVPGSSYGTPGSSRGHRMWRMLRRLRRGPEPAITTVLDSGVRTQTGSLYYNWAIGGTASRAVRRRLLKATVDRMLRGAGGEGRVFHVWVHPFNLGESRVLLDDFLEFMDRISRLRDRGELSIEGMAPHHARSLSSR